MNLEWMMRLPFKRHRQGRHGKGRHFKGRSLMPKLLLVLLATGILVEFTVGGFYRLLFNDKAHAALERNVVHYAHALAAEIGAPLDSLKAREIAEQYSLRIRYQGPEGNWDSRPGLELNPTLKQGGSAHESGQVGWCRGRFCVNVPLGAGELLFVPDFRQMMENHVAYLALVILIVSTVLAGAFMLIRRLLSPLKSLSEAAERLGQGELGHQVPVCSHDEFGGLAQSFNTMSSRLAALVKAREQLLLDVSHELRSPLTRIKVALELAPEGTDTDGIREDIREMEAMIAEILETARMNSEHGKLNLEIFDLESLVADAVADANVRPPGAVVKKSGSRPGTVAGAGFGAESSSLVKADRMRIRKVLGNILDNGVKFSQGQEAPVEVTVDVTPAEATVRIRDYGLGIAEAELSNLFEPFYRIDRSRSRDTGGYGLGLSLCKRIMEAHGGRIEITSREGSGTEVSLVLPANSIDPSPPLP